ncbi:MAG: flavodoxin domain-containing protein [Promethearchaeota archaeon]
MKIAILFDSKYGNTKTLAEFMAEKMQARGHEVRLFRTKKTKPKELIEFQPMALLVGGPTHMGKPALTLGRYIKKLGKLGQSSPIHNAAVFNCYTGNIVCNIIQDQLSKALPQIEIFEKSLPIRTGGQNGEIWKEVALQNNWKEEANSFISAFLIFLSEKMERKEKAPVINT